MIAYHITSNRDIRKFDISKVGSGMGTSFYGHGLYFALDRSTCEEYYKKMPRSQKYYIYKVEISNKGIFNEDQQVKDGKTALELYAELVEETGSEKKATSNILKLGVNGIKYFSYEDGNAVVMYTSDGIKILEKVECNKVLNR